MRWLTEFVDHPYLLALAVLVALPLLWQYFRLFFGDLGGFVDDAELGGASDWDTLLKGRYVDGQWAELKIAFFVLICVALVASFYKNRDAGLLLALQIIGR